MSLRRTLAALTLLGGVLAGGAPASAAPLWPDVVALGDGYRPEGIAAAGGTAVFVGSIPTGAVSRVDVRTGSVETVVPPRPGERAAIGLEEAGGLLFVAAGPTGNAFVYDARTGADVATLDLAPTAETFINDVVTTRDAAWFTDSRSLVVSRVDRRTLEVTPLPLSGITPTGGRCTPSRAARARSSRSTRRPVRPRRSSLASPMATGCCATAPRSTSCRTGSTRWPSSTCP